LNDRHVPFFKVFRFLDIDLQQYRQLRYSALFDNPILGTDHAFMPNAVIASRP